MLFHSISWACNQNQAVCSSQPACSIQLLLLQLNLLKLLQSVHWSHLHVAVHQHFCRDIKYTGILGGFCGGEGVCSDVGWPGHCQHPLLSQNIWESARTSAPGTDHRHQALATALTATGSSGEREEQADDSPARKSAGCFSFTVLPMQQLLQLGLGCFLDGDFTKVWIFNISPCLEGGEN